MSADSANFATLKDKCITDVKNWQREALEGFQICLLTLKIRRARLTEQKTALPLDEVNSDGCPQQDIHHKEPERNKRDWDRFLERRFSFVNFFNVYTPVAKHVDFDQSHAVAQDLLR